MSKEIVWFSLLAGCLIATSLVLLGNSALGSCPADIEDRIPIPHSEWSIVTEAVSCGATYPDTMTIYAENSMTHERSDLVSFGDMAESSVAIRDGEIVVTVPNLVDILQKADRFQKYPITLVFTPRDDPTARRKYHVWMHDPDDPEAQRWQREYLEQKHALP